MRVSVLFFAVTRELVGSAETTVELSDSAPTIAALVAALEDRYHGLRGRMSSVRIAKNERFAGPHELLRDGDVVALVPPVSGG
jgi:molybdopterin synthase sulfur carrier subunit